MGIIASFTLSTFILSHLLLASSSVSLGFGMSLSMGHQVLISVKSLFHHCPEQPWPLSVGIYQHSVLRSYKVIVVVLSFFRKYVSVFSKTLLLKEFLALSLACQSVSFLRYIPGLHQAHNRPSWLCLY